MLLYTDINKGNKTISFDPYIKQLGIQTSRAGYRFKIYLNNY